ncbi:Pol polyprotein [Elysia marginata]|uniref:Pol polyprotein n=1 Tax=Elysia marginata TaxID=1093978 RepID=A0AAV4I1A0_9GAST|nr:Pol polyprotein [Elysia marginata]
MRYGLISTSCLSVASYADHTARGTLTSCWHDVRTTASGYVQTFANRMPGILRTRTLSRGLKRFSTASRGLTFSVLDMKSGYFQVKIAEEHRQRTAFTIGTIGFYEYCGLPFGLSNSPITYKRLMEDILGDMHVRIKINVIHVVTHMTEVGGIYLSVAYTHPRRRAMMIKVRMNS